MGAAESPASRPHLLHVFSTFVPAGPQVRTAGLLAAFGDEFRHSLVAMDGRLDARELVSDAVEIDYLEAPPKAGSLATIPRMRALVRRAAPDLVLTYNFGAIDTALALRLPQPGASPPLVHHEDGFRPDEVESLKLRRTLMRRVALGGSARVIVISETLQRIAEQVWRLDGERLHLIPNGIDAARYQRSAEQDTERAALWADLGIPAEACVVGAVGHLRPEKNLGRLLRAAEPLADVQLLVLGEGPERGDLEALAAETALAGRVHFVGYHGDPRAHYRAMDVFALPSDTEQMPMSLLEAMASGLPAVATDVGDVRAILPQVQAAQVVSLGASCEEQFSRALASLVRDAGTRRALGAANRERILERFTKDRMVRAYRELYGRALGR